MSDSLQQFNTSPPKKLTVMQILPELKVGGVERGTVEFAVYLKQLGHESIVVSQGGPLVEELRYHGVQHICLDVKSKSLLTLRSVSKLRSMMIQKHVDVVHARSRIPAWVSYFALRKMSSRPRFITTLHGLHSVNIYSSVMARGDQVIAVSATAKDYLIKHFKQHLATEPVIINRGVDSQFKYGYQTSTLWLKQMQEIYPHFTDRQNVLIPGRLSAVKGVENIISWLKIAPANTQLLLTGHPNESNYSRRLKALFVENQVAEKVSWLGVIRSMPDLYAAVDVVVSVNNKPESFGRTVLEALTTGKPVVAFNHGGVSEVMAQLYPEGLVPAGDAQALANKINLFLHKPPAVKQHNLYRNDSMFKQILAVYQQPREQL